MPHIPPLLAGCILTGAIAITTGATWIGTAGRLSPAAIVICAAISVAASLTVECGRPGGTPPPAGPAPTPLDHHPTPQTPTLTA